MLFRSVDSCVESGYSTTASDGTYEIGALPDTSYFVRIEPAFTDTRHLTGWYADDPPANHAASQDLAGVVSVASDPVTVDVTLPRLATIAGTITTVGAVPVDGAQLRICANAFDCWSPLADAAGRFESEPLAPGDYTVEVWAPFDNPLAVLDGWYRAGVAGNYTDDATLASLISLTGGDVVADVRLPKGLQISGRVTRAGGLLEEVGLGYIRLGQPLNVLSGGESQRLKLARHLAESSETTTSHTLFLFDEPTTGLHMEDVRILLETFQRLVDRGHSLLVIEHNLDVIRASDWIVDLGPEAGEAGGTVVVAGPPERVARCAVSHTGRFLRSLGL